jgi:acyl-coenzyme A thioesterase PaaI-like protein
MKTELMRPAMLHEHYAMRGDVVRLGRQVAYAEAVIKNDKDEIVSRSTGTFMVHRAEEA